MCYRLKTVHKPKVFPPFFYYVMLKLKPNNDDDIKTSPII